MNAAEALMHAAECAAGKPSAIAALCLQMAAKMCQVLWRSSRQLMAGQQSWP